MGVQSHYYYILMIVICAIQVAHMYYHAPTYRMTRVFNVQTSKATITTLDRKSLHRLTMIFSSDAEKLRQLGKKVSDVVIEAPSMNSRRITASIVIDRPFEVVWSILTDYNNLSTHVPNLVQSYLVPNKQNKTRLYQEGAQKIIGFDFRASLTMEMTEEKYLRDASNNYYSGKDWKIHFKLVESRMFAAFDGVWILQELPPEKSDNNRSPKYRTKLTYSVFVRPKGPVPVMALEWRIREDIPLNLYAVKIASEKLIFNSDDGSYLSRDGMRRVIPSNSDSSNMNNNYKGILVTDQKNRISSTANVAWEPDETLGSYMAMNTSSNNNSLIKQTS